MSPIRQTVTVVGRNLEPDDYRIRDFLTRTAQPYLFYDAGTAQANEVLAEHNLTDDDLPVVIDQGTVHRATSLEQIAEAWQLSQPPSRSHYDLAIVGAGPAGLAAAVYAASDGLSTLILDSDVPGGQASYTSMIENFFGFVDGVGGAELARLAGRQAEGFGAEIVMLRGVVGSRVANDHSPTLIVDGGFQVSADVAVVATGMEWRRLEVDGVEDLLGRGIYYGAGRSEASHCGGDHVVVVGAGNSAGQAVLNLAQAGAQVTMAVRGDALARTMSDYLVRRIERAANIDVRLRTHVTAVEGNSRRLTAVTTTDAAGAKQCRPARALFLCIGGVPRTGWAAEAAVRTNERGFILTGPDLLEAGRRPDDWPLDRDPLTLETSVAGLFAAGDVRSGSTKRVAGAVGEGAMAAALVHRRLEELARVS